MAHNPAGSIQSRRRNSRRGRLTPDLGNCTWKSMGTAGPGREELNPTGSKKYLQEERQPGQSLKRKSVTPRSSRYMTAVGRTFDRVSKCEGHSALGKRRAAQHDQSTGEVSANGKVTEVATEAATSQAEGWSTRRYGGEQRSLTFPGATRGRSAGGRRFRAEATCWNPGPTVKAKKTKLKF